MPPGEDQTASVAASLMSSTNSSASLRDNLMSCFLQKSSTASEIFERVSAPFSGASRSPRAAPAILPPRNAPREPNVFSSFLVLLFEWNRHLPLFRPPPCPDEAFARGWPQINRKYSHLFPNNPHCGQYFVLKKL